MDSQSDVDRFGYLSHQGTARAGGTAPDAGRIGLLLGPLAAAAARLATGDHIPVFAARARIVSPPARPRWPQPLLAWAICGAVRLVGAAMAAAVDGTGRSRDSVPAGSGLTSSGRGGTP